VKKRFFVSLVVAGAGLIAWLVLTAESGRFRYKGKSVKTWAKLAHSGDPTAAVRLAAARALGNLGQRAKPAVPELGKALEDTDEAVRTAAKDALQKIEH